MNRGRHASSGSREFLRDLAVVSVVVVAAAVLTFGAIKFFAGRGSTGDTQAGGTLPTTLATTTTTTSTTTTTTLAPTTEAPTTVPALLPPSDLTVIVFNAVGTPGLAAQVTQVFTDAGYQTLTPDNFGTPLERSIIWFTRQDLLDEAHELARYVPDANIQFSAKPVEGVDADLVVAIGQSYSG